MKNPIDTLEKIRQEYAPYDEIAVSELQKVDQLRKEWEDAKDPAWIAFRENPKTQALFKHAATIYKNGRLQLSNDDGTMDRDQRMKLYISGLWAKWFMQALGGSPESVQKSVEEEITRFAHAAGVDI